MKKKYPIVLVVLIAILWSPWHAAVASNLDSLIVRVDRLFAEWDKPGSPGCALGVIQDGKLIFARGYGMANLEYDIPITPKSVFRIGSTSKQFTAMCMALLEEQGKCSLDDDIRTYLPEIPVYDRPITIRHLIHHTSGVRDYLTLMSLAGMRDDDYLVDGEVLDLIARQKSLNFTPGDDRLYSNSGYFLLSVIVKRVSGQTLREFAREHIFEPLGMANTHFHDDHTMIVTHRASGYLPTEDGGFRICMTTLDMVGDGGVFTSVDDLTKWDTNFYDNRLGSGGEGLIRRMLETGHLNNGEPFTYAMGLNVGEYRGLKMISHGGAFVGFRAEMIRFPEQRFSIICLANLGTFQPTRLARRVADIFLADVFPETSEEKTTTPDEASFIPVSPKNLKKLVGLYHQPETHDMWNVFLQEDKLFTKVNGGQPLELAALSKTAFVPVQFPSALTVTFKAQKPRMLLEVQRGDGEPTAYEAMDAVDVPEDRLAGYTGNYFSDELMVTYRVVKEEGRLFLRHENEHKDYPKEPLEPTLTDWFVVAGMGVHFIRDAKDAVTGFSLNAGRVKDIRFVRTPDAE